MTFAKELKFAADAPVLPSKFSQGSSLPTSGLKRLFVGPDGLRAGWRLLIFVVILVALLASLVIIRGGGVAVFQKARKMSSEITMTPSLMLKSEAVSFTLLCIATLIMGKIERRKFGAYGLPWTQSLGKNLGLGALLGFGMISGTLLVLYLLNAYRITGLALHGAAILPALAAWAIAFLLVGLFEEFMLRGYMQYTLGSGIGSWPAAFVLSAVFAFGHSFNPHETMVGSITTGYFGLLLCFFLRRTGNLWCAVGFHMAYDWGQTFYGVPDSGIVPYHNTFTSVFHGPVWLTGGIVGPEGSFLTPLALLTVAMIFSRLYRQNQCQSGGQA